MGRANIIDIIYTKNRSPLEFSFDSLRARPLYSLLSPQDIYELNKIATSVRLSSNPKKKYSMIDNILVPRGFKKLASGTNRITYKYLEDQSIVIKVAIDKVGIADNPREFYNQYLLKPFVTKVFEVSPCGTVGLFERVVPITSREEYLSVANDVFDMITTQIIGKYVVDDIGTRYFQNIGVRPGMGIVLLDFPYVYELDGNKLYCNKKDNYTNQICGGEIDYDEGFNKLICTKCGKRYYAYQLRKFEQEKKISIKKEGEKKMKISIVKGNNNVVRTNEVHRSSDTLPRNKSRNNTTKNYGSKITIVPPENNTRKEINSSKTPEYIKNGNYCETVSAVMEKKVGKIVNEFKEKIDNIVDKQSDSDIEETYKNNECNPNISSKDYKNTIDDALKMEDYSQQYDDNLGNDDDVIEISGIEIIPRDNSTEVSEAY